MKSEFQTPIRYKSILFLILIVMFISSCEKVRENKTLTIIKAKDGTEMVLIPAGSFEMGSQKSGESPIHKVWIDSFMMDRNEVTQEQYEKLVLGNPSHFKGAKNPMEQMRWSDAALFCNARSRAEGLEPCYNEQTGKCNFQANGYRLPTEAEWEYACRAGTNTDYFFGNNARELKSYAWYTENSLNKTHPAGQKKPNPWGLYDMYGNVAEWCNDIYDESYYENSPEKNPQGPAEGKRRVLRGGSWSSSNDRCRSSSRAGENPGFQDACFARDNIGFRCVKKATQSVQALEKLEQKNFSAVKGEILSIPLLKREIPDKVPKTGFVYHDIYLQHITGADHPEKPQRLEAIVTRLKDKGLLSQLALIVPAPANPG